MSGLYQHTELLALLQAAKEQPEDNSVRLILADWLEEHGDGHRAEFLRLQCASTPGSTLSKEESSKARERIGELLGRFGGAWLGSLWQHGGSWHRGFLSVELARQRVPAGLDEMLPWIDSLHIEVPGREALRFAVDLLSRTSLNHVTQRLRRPFAAEQLLAPLGAVPASPCLRTLTFHWAPGMGRRTRTGVFIDLNEDFFVRLVRLPISLHLTHLASLFNLTEDQAGKLRTAGVEPVLARDRHWPHTLRPDAFRPREVRAAW